jgi:protein-disulfide isomerase
LNRFQIIVIVAVIGFFGVVVTSKNQSSEGDSGAPIASSSHFLGEKNANVTLLEYADFQCPACQAFNPVVKQVVEKYKDQISFQFKHFPLTQIHPNAFASSRAAEAAGKQDKFWEMHDLLYENQSQWSGLTDPFNTFTGYAISLGLDGEQFKVDYASSEINDIVNADYREAMSSGATSTPTFVLNGKRLEQNPSSLEEFDQLIADAIAN